MIAIALKFRRRKYVSKLTLFTTLLFILVIAAVITVTPVLKSIAVSSCAGFTKSAVYEAASALSGRYSYEDMVYVSRDLSHISDIGLNSAKSNELRNELIKELNSVLSDRERSVLSVPLGNLTGLVLLSGRGPDIRIRLVPMGSAEADVKSSFTEAGINQTKHTVYVSVSVEMRIMAPFSDCVCKTETTVPLAETIIVGDVPSFYCKQEK